MTRRDDERRRGAADDVTDTGAVAGGALWRLLSGRGPDGEGRARRVLRVAFALVFGLVFWTVGWPFYVLWLPIRHALRPRPQRVQLRIARLERWYPSGWRERYGIELRALLEDSIADGRGGPRLSFDVARAGLRERAAEPGAERNVLVVALMSTWAIFVFPQGVMPIVLHVVGLDVRSWFLAAYMPGAGLWVTALAMIALGFGLLATACRLVRVGPGR
jgi:hypothetical protein